MSSKPKDNRLTTGQAAKILGVSRARVRQFCAAGRLGVWVFGRWAITRVELRRFARIARPCGRPPKDAP